ncbi:MAG: hypothetical protein H0X43_10815 [Nitrosospira sp.]|nr:hypothetical protein [Nitrosospira sp.]
MKTVLALLWAYLVFSGTHAHANLCDSVKDTTTTAETKRDVDFYEELFSDPKAEHRGNRKWNEIILECNRRRDTKGNEVAKATAASGSNEGKQLLKARDLDPKVIRGHYNFFGIPSEKPPLDITPAQQKYVYVLSKNDGVWTMTIPYRPIINELVPDRVDFYIGEREVDHKTNTLSPVTQAAHAWRLYDASQVIITRDPSTGEQVLTLKPVPQPIATTLCSTSTYFPGEEGKYDGQSGVNAYKRDSENKFISLGKIQYRYKKDDAFVYEGCRVDEDRDLFWQDPEQSNEVIKVKPQDWILDNFVRTSETYWTISRKFELKLLMKGRNDSAFPKETLDLLRDNDHLTVRFATKFPPYGFNQMYKSNPVQFNNFSTMTSDGTYLHEVGHAFGLDDEYGGETNDGVDKENSCLSAKYKSFSTDTYQMCEGGATDKRTIYHYLAVSRYITKQSVCNSDSDCDAGRYCDKGTITIGKNQCVALKADNESCDLVGGGHQCKGGECKFSRCYTPNSVAMGGTCYVDDACKEGQCSSVNGTKGTCVCDSDSECGTGKYCDKGTITVGKNQCVALKADNESCDVAGGGHQCQGGECKFSRCYTPNSVAMGGTCYVDDACKEGKCSAIDSTKGTCVCKSDSDCGAGNWCDAGSDTKINACRTKLSAGQSCGKAGSVGNDHKCKSGKCSGFPKYECK